MPTVVAVAAAQEFVAAPEIQFVQFAEVEFALAVAVEAKAEVEDLEKG